MTKERYVAAVLACELHYEQDSDGSWGLSVPGLPQFATHGETREDARGDLVAALGGYFDSYRRRGEFPPLPPGAQWQATDIVTGGTPVTMTDILAVFGGDLSVISTSTQSPLAIAH